MKTKQYTQNNYTIRETTKAIWHTQNIPDNKVRVVSRPCSKCGSNRKISRIVRYGKNHEHKRIEWDCLGCLVRIRTAANRLEKKQPVKDLWTCISNILTQ